MSLPTPSEWLYSGKVLLAGLLAFYLALAIPLPNPYWSFATVYIVSHPLSGATRSKAMYRAIGTLIGAAVAVALVPVFAGQPLLLVLSIGAWSALALYLSLRDNKPSAYSFLLASYTTPLVAVSAVIEPGLVFDTAVARSEEILLGIVCASVVSTVLFPSRVLPVFGERVAALMKDAGAWSASRLAEPGRHALPPLRFHLLRDIVALDAVITHLGYDATRHSQTGEARQLRFRMTMLIPQVASLADALRSLQPDHVQALPGVDGVLAEVAAWLREGIEGDPARGDALRAAIAALRSPHRAATLAALPAANAADRLRDVVDLWQDCLALHRAFNEGGRTAPVLAYRAPVPDHRRRHYDHGFMVYAAASSALAFVLAGWAWLVSGWPGGSGGVVMVAVATAFFAGSDSPAPLVGRFLLWEGISIAAAMVYLFGILPGVTNFVELALVLAPPLLLVGTFTGRPAFSMGVLLLTSQTISDIALRNGSSANFEDFANYSLGMLAGLIYAVAWSAMTRPFGTDMIARRLARANWREQVAFSRRRVPLDGRVALSRVVDRTAQWLPRLALISAESLASMDAVRDLRLCVALLDLRELGHRGTRAARALDPVLDASGGYFEQCLDAKNTLAPPRHLLAAIDAGMAALVAEDADLASALLRYRIALLALPPERRPDRQASGQPTSLIPL